MAVPAVEADAPDVVGMAELNRLLDVLVLLGGPGGPHQHEDKPADDGAQSEDTEKGGANQCIGTARKDLAHRGLRGKYRSGQAPAPDWRLYDVKCFTNLSNPINFEVGRATGPCPEIEERP